MVYFENTQHSVVIIDLNFCILNFSEIFRKEIERIYGKYRADSIHIGMSIENILEDEIIIKSFMEDAENVVENRSTFSRIVTFGEKNQYCYGFLLHPYLVDSEIAGCVWMLINIDDQFSVTDKDDISFRLSILDNCPDVILALDSNYNYLYFNRAHIREMEFHIDDAEAQIKRGVNFICLLNESQKTIVLGNWAPVVTGQMDIREIVTEFPTDTGEIFFYSMRMSKLENSRGEVIGTLCIAANITDSEIELKANYIRLREAERKYKKTIKELEVANETKNLFLSNMSHELRTPMNPIIGFAQLILENDELPDEIKKQVRVILKSANHQLRIINNILDLVQLNCGNMRMSIESVKLTPLVNQVVELYSAKATKNNVTVIVDEDTFNNVYIKVDKQRAIQVLMNIHSNAIKYNKPGGSITIKVHKTTKNRVIVRFHDTGIGIPKEKQSDLFKRFERLGKETTGIEGTGIGLSYSKDLMHMMKGDIKIRSREHRYTKVDIQFRKAKALLSESIENSSNENHNFKKPRRLLYIEDNLQNIDLMQTILKTTNILIYTSIQGSIGLELAESIHPDIIILDVHLPDMSGEEVLKILGEKYPKIPVICISADATAHAKRIMLRLGARDYIVKPIKSVQHVRHVINDWINRKIN